MLPYLETQSHIEGTPDAQRLRQVCNLEALLRNPQHAPIDVGAVDAEHVFDAEFAGGGEPGADAAADVHNRFRRNNFNDVWKHATGRTDRSVGLLFVKST